LFFILSTLAIPLVPTAWEGHFFVQKTGDKYFVASDFESGRAFQYTYQQNQTLLVLADDPLGYGMVYIVEQKTQTCMKISLDDGNGYLSNFLFLNFNGWQPLAKLYASRPECEVWAINMTFFFDLELRLCVNENRKPLNLEIITTFDNMVDRTVHTILDFDDDVDEMVFNVPDLCNENNGQNMISDISALPSKTLDILGIKNLPLNNKKR